MADGAGATATQTWTMTTWLPAASPSISAVRAPHCPSCSPPGTGHQRHRPGGVFGRDDAVLHAVVAGLAWRCTCRTEPGQRPELAAGLRLQRLGGIAGGQGGNPGRVAGYQLRGGIREPIPAHLRGHHLVTCPAGGEGVTCPAGGAGTLPVTGPADAGGLHRCWLGRCGRSSMVEPQPSKLVMRVRFPSPAPTSTRRSAPMSPS